MITCLASMSARLLAGRRALVALAADLGLAVADVRGPLGDHVQRLLRDHQRRVAEDVGDAQVAGALDRHLGEVAKALRRRLLVALEYDQGGDGRAPPLEGLRGPFGGRLVEARAVED